jgi:hypothetical protein
MDCTFSPPANLHMTWDLPDQILFPICPLEVRNSSLFPLHTKFGSRDWIWGLGGMIEDILLSTFETWNSFAVTASSESVVFLLFQEQKSARDRADYKWHTLSPCCKGIDRGAAPNGFTVRVLQFPTLSSTSVARFHIGLYLEMQQSKNMKQANSAEAIKSLSKPFGYIYHKQRFTNMDAVHNGPSPRLKGFECVY